MRTWPFQISQSDPRAGRTTPGELRPRCSRTISRQTICDETFITIRRRIVSFRNTDRQRLQVRHQKSHDDGNFCRQAPSFASAWTGSGDRQFQSRPSQTVASGSGGGPRTMTSRQSAVSSRTCCVVPSSHRGMRLSPVARTMPPHPYPHHTSDPSGLPEIRRLFRRHWKCHRLSPCRGGRDRGPGPGRAGGPVRTSYRVSGSAARC